MADEELDAALVERVYAALYESYGNSIRGKDHVRAVLRSLPITAAALNALARGEATVVPNEPTEAMREAGKDARLAQREGTPPGAALAGILRAMLAASPYAAKE